MLNFYDIEVPAFLVGGWVRDRLLNQTSNQIPNRISNRISKAIDLDFVLPSQAVETARAIAKKYNAGFVLLDPKRQIARVVFKDGTADFAQQMGDSIIVDLSRRDFAMNAIAIDCANMPTSLPISQIHQIHDLTHLIDPFLGQQDIQGKLVRMISDQNLQDDSLRILRAYRQAAQLGFDIDPETRTYLIKLAPTLKNIAAERIRTELTYLLALGINGTKWLCQAAQDQILSAWIAPKNLMIARVSLVDQAIAQVINQWQDLDKYFNNVLSGDRSVTVIVKLAALSASATALENLGFSRLEQRWIVTLLRHLPQFRDYLDQGKVSAQNQYQLFTATNEMFPALCVLAIASGSSFDLVIPWLEQWLNPNDPIAHQIPLLNGDDLKIELGLTAGQKIGEILSQLKLAQVDQIITDRQNAIAYAKSLI